MGFVVFSFFGGGGGGGGCPPPPPPGFDLRSDGSPTRVKF